MGEVQGPQGRQELLEWLGLRLIPGMGSVGFARLVGAFGSPGAALGAPLAALRRVPKLRAEVAEAVHNRAWERPPEEELARLEKLGGRLVTLGGSDYPPLLAQVFAPPPLLYAAGDLACCREGGVALVGSRNATTYGKRVAAELADGLARAGVTVVSGLALGIDGAAHEAALAAGGATVGVLGCGLDIFYPREHRDLARRMAAQGGAVISEFPLGASPRPGHFPVRNRIIAGLSRAVVVVEAGLKSGALITARHALDQGREVMAVPGPVTSPQSAGCHELLRNGAALVAGVEDIVGQAEGLPLAAATRRPDESAPDLPPEAARLLEHLGPAPVHVDELARAAGLMPQEVMALLVNLELAGCVTQLPGKNYVLD